MHNVYTFRKGEMVPKFVSTVTPPQYQDELRFGVDVVVHIEHGSVLVYPAKPLAEDEYVIRAGHGITGIHGDPLVVWNFPKDDPRNVVSPLIDCNQQEKT
jgi:hypothetical protein